MYNETNSMTVAETADYLAKQMRKGWPGSRSIHPVESAAQRKRRLNKKARKV